MSESLIKSEVTRIIELEEQRARVAREKQRQEVREEAEVTRIIEAREFREKQRQEAREEAEDFLLAVLQSAKGLGFPVRYEYPKSRNQYFIEEFKTLADDLGLTPEMGLLNPK